MFFAEQMPKTGSRKQRHKLIKIRSIHAISAEIWNITIAMQEACPASSEA